ncbi:hypothetical protein OG379_40550 (plasmid) [Streptomyces sp. NBC_01166]|uniref:hypothetical protein n=1 Tax=Streptomyces sp. NBC_01166 TaxID=2903755 RepID=UPI002F9094A7|nr:hypothetical protein OG379_40550 [Streptomyces sp. NBC_01166]
MGAHRAAARRHHGPYTPDTDPFVQEELAIEQRRQDAVQTELEVQQRIAERADELAQQTSTPDTTTVSQAGDEAARDHLAQQGDGRVEKVDAWLPQALADHNGHYADPATRTAAAATLPAAIRAHAALLSALARTGTPADVTELPFTGCLAHVDPAATAALAAWLATSLAADSTSQGALLPARSEREQALAQEA